MHENNFILPIHSCTYAFQLSGMMNHYLLKERQILKYSSVGNGSIIKYKCTADGFIAETPLGEGFNAKFDGKDYPVKDDPGHTMVSAKLLSPDTVQLTSKRNGEVVAIRRMSVMPGRKSIHVVFKNKEGNTMMTFDMQKEP